MKILSTIWFRNNREFLDWQDHVLPEIHEVRLAPVLKENDKIEWYITATYYIERNPTEKEQ